jgi:imidazolonepropionase-like amidohydrolase
MKMLKSFKTTITMVMLLTAGLVSACEKETAKDATEEGGKQVDLALHGLNIINVADGTILKDHSIMIDDGKIVGIVSATKRDGILAKNHQAHSGAYAIPALWDMHVHFRGGPELVKSNEGFLKQFVGFGITGVRDAGGDMPMEVLKWRSEIIAGTRVGPEIYTSLQKLDGLKAGWPGSIPLETEADIEPALDKLVGDGADFIKVYTSTLDNNLFLPTVRATEARGLQVGGHVPFAIPMRDVVDAGYDHIEHAMYLHKAASPRDKELSDAAFADRAAGRGMFEKLINSFDKDHAMAEFAYMAAQGTAVTPTLYVDHLLRYLDTNDHTDDLWLGEIPADIADTYKGRVAGAMRRDAARIAADHARIAETMSLVPMAAEAGMTILTGSDTGAFNSYVYPGDSLHQEMRIMVEAGLTPLKALQGATITGAKFMGLDDVRGTIEVGKIADILILSHNPLDDINNTRTFKALIDGGTSYNAGALARLRNMVEQ